MKLHDTETNEPGIPVVELTERRILLKDGRYLIFFSGTVERSSSVEPTAVAAEEKDVRT